MTDLLLILLLATLVVYPQAYLWAIAITGAILVGVVFGAGYFVVALIFSVVSLTWAVTMLITAAVAKAFSRGRA